METIRTTVANNVLSLVLANKAMGNSFGVHEAQQLNAIMDKYFLSPPKSGDSGAIKALVFSNDWPRIFCSGGNLKDYHSQAMDSSKGIEVNRSIAQSLKRLAELPVPTLAVVKGDCFGGGMELLSCFDQSMVTPYSLLGFWQRRIGLVYGWGGGVRWAEKVPVQRLKTLCLEGRSLGAYEALSCGLIGEVVPLSHINFRADQWLLQVTGLSYEPVPAIKSFTADIEQSQFESLWLNADHKKALDHFVKRTKT